MQALWIDLGRSSAAASVMGILLLGVVWVWRKQIPPFWSHALLLIAVFRWLIFIPPVSTCSWERLVPEGIARTQSPPQTSPSNAAAGASDSAESGSRKLDGKPPMKAAAPASFGSRVPGPPVAKVKPASISPAAVAGIVWLGGFVAVLAAIGRSIARLHRVLRTAREPDRADPVLRLLREALKLAGMKRAPRLLVCDSGAIRAPSLTGLIRPAILVPRATLSHLGNDEIRTVLLHELGHLQRRDPWWNALLLAVQTVHWFNPFAWFYCRRVRVAAERATDEWVLQRIGDQGRRTYGNALIQLLEHSSSASLRSATALGVAEDGGGLRQRIAAIANFKQRSRRTASLVCLLLVGILGVVGLTQSPEEPEKHKFEIRFQAVNERDNPVPGANVRIYELEESRVGELLRTAATDDLGRYQTELFAASKGVFVEVKGEQDKLLGGGPVSPVPGKIDIRYAGAIVPGSKVPLYPAGILRVRFMDIQNQPIAGMTLFVTAFHWGEDEQSHRYFDTLGKTGPDGRAAIPIPAGFRFTIHHDRHDLTNIRDAGAVAPRSDEKDEFVFQLNPAHTLRGKVLYPDGRPVEGVFINNHRSNSEWLDATTAEDGSFAIHHLEPGTHRLKTNWKRDDWYVEDELVVAISGEQPETTHSFTVKKGNTLQVRFINSLTGEWIATTPHPGLDPKSTSLSIFALQKPEGFHHPRGNEVRFSFHGRPETTIEVPVKPLAPEDTVHGRVVNESGTPVRGAKVIIYPKMFHDPVWTDQEGRFSHVFPDREASWDKHATLYAEKDGLSSAKLEWPFGSKTEAVLVLRKPVGGTVRGTVTDEQGEPIAGAEVLLWSTDMHEYRTAVSTGESGNYEFREVRPGIEVVVHATHPAYGVDDYRGAWKEKKWVPLTVTSEQTIEIPRISLPLANNEITGRVVDAKGNPIRNAVLFVYQTHRQPERRVQTDENGNFRIPNLIAGWIDFELRTEIAMDEQPWREFQIRSGSRDVTLTMPPRGKRRLYSADGLDFIGKKAPPLVVEEWVNAGRPPAPGPEKGKIRFIALLALDRPLHYVASVVRSVQRASEKHPEVEFLILHRNTPKERVLEDLAKIGEKGKITLPVGIEPFLGGMSEALEWAHGGALAVDDQGVVIAQSKSIEEVLKSLDGPR